LAQPTVLAHSDYLTYYLGKTRVALSFNDILPETQKMATDSPSWYPNPRVVLIGNGAKVNLHLLSGKERKYTIEEAKKRLKTKWGTSFSQEPALEEIQQELTKLGYSLTHIAAKLGDDRKSLTATQQLDKERKARADLAEILTAMTQEDIRQIPKEDIFLVFKRKISVAAPEHGTDLIAFHFDKSHEEIFPRENETITLAESKYTSSTSDLKSAFEDIKSWILTKVTMSRLYAELTNIADEYRRFGRELECLRTLGFMRSIVRRDEGLLVLSTILYGDTVADDIAVANCEGSVLQALDKHEEGAIPHARFEALLFKTSALDEFCVSCYEDFST